MVVHGQEFGGLVRSFLKKATDCATSYDPTTFLVGVAAWEFLSAVSLLLPGTVFDISPVYSVVRLWWLTEDQWGVIFLANAALIIASIGLGPMIRSRSAKRNLVPFRASVAILNGALCLLWGGLILAGAAGIVPGTAPFFSAGGAYWVFCGLGCFLAGTQWVSQEVP